MQIAADFFTATEDEKDRGSERDEATLVEETRSVTNIYSSSVDYRYEAVRRSKSEESNEINIILDL